MEPIFSQTAGKYDIIIDQGVTWSEVIQLCTNDAMTTYFDLTGYTPKAQIRNVKNGTLIAEFTCAVLGDAVNGQIQVTLSMTQTAALNFSGKYYWDLIIAVGTTAYRVVEGSVELSKSVTVPA